MAANYNVDLADFGLDSAGRLGFALVGTWLDKLETDTGLGLARSKYDCAGFFANQCGEPDVGVAQAVVEGLVGEEVAAPVADDGQAGLPPGFTGAARGMQPPPLGQGAGRWVVGCLPVGRSGLGADVLGGP